MQYIGDHLLGDFSGVPDSIVNNPSQLLDSLGLVLAREGLNVVNFIEHRFSPHGFTAALILQESHAIIHTYPEYNYVSIEIFSCRPLNAKRIEESLSKITSAGSCSSQLIHRYAKSHKEAKNEDP